MMQSKLVYNTPTLNIYVGNKEAAEDESWMDSANITDAFNVSGLKLNKYSEYVNWYSTYFIGDDEILDKDRPKLLSVLKSICLVIEQVRESNVATIANPLEKRNVLIFCLTGRQSSVLTAGYYILNYTKPTPKATDKVYELQRIYFDAKDKEDETRDIILFDSLTKQATGDSAAPINNDNKQLQSIIESMEKRKEKRCLSNLSFRVMLDPQQKRNMLFE